MSTSEDKRLVDLAVRLAEQSLDRNEGGPFGALVVGADRILGQGWNRVLSTNDPTAHAEVVAIREACRQLGRFSLAGCRLYASCEPCPMCLSACYWARLDGVYYAATRTDAARAGFSDAVLYDELALPVDERSLPIRHVLTELARAPFLAWEVKADKTLY